MIVMGIDASLTSTGVVVLDGDNILLSRAIVTKPGDYQSTIIRLCKIRQEVVSCINKHKPGRICIEGFSYGSKGMAVMQIGMLGGLLREALEYARLVSGVEWSEVPPTTLKKYVTGKGNSAKDEMRLWAYKKWAVDFPTHDQVDAYALARYAQMPPQQPTMPIQGKQTGSEGKSKGKGIKRLKTGNMEGMA